MGYILHQEIHGDVTEPQVHIKDGTNLYNDTPANFELDYGSAFPTLQTGQYIREYVADRRHSIFDDKEVFLISGPAVWAEGDAIIAALSALVAAKDAREYVAPTLEEAQAAGRADIDSVAGQARSRYITVAPGQEMTYLEKSDQAADYVTAGYPADTSNYPFVQAEMNATGQSKEDAADGILAQKSAWIAVGVQIEEHRLGGKAAVDAATDLAGVDSAVSAAVALLDAV